MGMTRGERLFALACALAFVGLVAFIVITVNHASDQKRSCWDNGGIVANAQHGDGWVCVDREGRLIK
jgi:hypothetical protein